MQTYKREGRIGKKKNRERKTRVINTVVLAAGNPFNPTLIPLVSMNGKNAGPKAQPSNKSEENQKELQQEASPKNERDMLNESQFQQIQRNILQAQLQQSLLLGAVPQIPQLGGFGLPRSAVDLGLLHNLSYDGLQRSLLANTLFTEGDYNLMSQLLHQMMVMQSKCDYSASLLTAMSLQQKRQFSPKEGNENEASELKIEDSTEGNMQSGAPVGKVSLSQRNSNPMDYEEYESKPSKKICQ